MARDLRTNAPVPAPRMSVHVEDELLEKLRAGEDSVFAEIVRAWSPVMMRVARFHVSTEASAEEVVQETWLAVIRGLDAFEGRSTVRTWVFRILTNLAKTRGVREARTVPMATLSSGDEADGVVDPDRFRGPDDEWPGHWTSTGAPTSWPTPESSVLGAEVRDRVAAALSVLPERQRVVVTLRDVHGLDSDEVCSALQISPANQRVLLHRGRAQVRAQLEDYYRGREREPQP
ncbi:MAG TPA: sigma-70 family RNA polymerase sigma factor [Actinomycetes bacterium]|nr:sigma-70 family RNA polymerase sigma factor [Actinomycetes bacterium]